MAAAWQEYQEEVASFFRRHRSRSDNESHGERRAYIPRHRRLRTVAPSGLRRRLDRRAASYWRKPVSKLHVLHF